MGKDGVKYGTEQKQPERKKYPKEKGGYEKTSRMKNNNPEFPTSEGDLGILRIKPQDIPKQTRAPSRTGDGKTNDVSKMRSIMKAQGMLD